MITKCYSYESYLWEVVLLGENPIDDRQVGTFKTEAEADACIVGLTFAN